MKRESPQRTVRLRIYGRVQGVFFRAWTVDAATRHGIAGWVRNRSDGSVEAVLSGPKDKVEDLIAACRLGPPRASVSRVEIAEAEEGEALEFGAGFQQAPTV